MRARAIVFAAVLLAGCASPVYQPLPAGVEREGREHAARATDRYYYLQGEVRRPGPEPYLGRTTLVQAVGAAVGFTDVADPKRLVVHRSDGSLERYDYYRVEKMTTNAPCLEPGDALEVKRKRFAW